MDGREDYSDLLKPNNTLTLNSTLISSPTVL